MPKFDFSQEAADTNAALAAEIAGLTSLSSNQIDEFFPAKIDKERLVELLEIVNSSADRNEKVANVRSNISNLAETVVRLVEAVV